MFTFFRIAGARNGMIAELLPFAASLIIAQMFFKWGSFSLELAGFLFAWWGLGFVQVQIIKLFRRS